MSRATIEEKKTKNKKQTCKDLDIEITRYRPKKKKSIIRTFLRD